MKRDLRVEDHGSIIIVRGQTELGQEWLDAEILIEEGDYQPESNARIFEPRYVLQPIINALNGYWLSNEDEYTPLTVENMNGEELGLSQDSYTDEDYIVVIS